jgi:acyl-CoA synthetase (AMP-forming)/AMP-acid ligase II
MTVLDDRYSALKLAGRLSGAAGENLGAIALRQAAADPGRIVVIDGDRSVSRQEMVDAACRLGAALRARGLKPGAAIAFQLPNWWEACVVNLAAALFRYRLVPLLTIYRASELEFILPACGVDALFVPATHRAFDFPAMIAGLSWRPRHVFVVRGDGAAADAFERLLASEPAAPEPASADDIKMVLFTSGSTGRPKGVMHSHASIDALIRRTAAFWGSAADDRFYIPSPIGHIGGSIYAFEFPWIVGCTAILADGWNPDEAVAAIDRDGATFMAGATPFLSGLIAAAERAGSRLPSLRRFVCGGASVPPELVRRALSIFANANVGRAYGSTEVPIVCPGHRSRADAEKRADTDGECTAELRLLADDGTPVPEGESGEILVRGPQMMMGYLDARDEEGCFGDDGFFRMGDIGRRIDGRFLEITGRKKEIIIRKGENISPLEIENALARCPALRQSAVVGIPDKERGEMVVAFVVLVEAGRFGFAEMTAHLQRIGLARQKFPERLHVMASLPTSSIGKVQKQELRAMAMEEARKQA